MDAERGANKLAQGATTNGSHESKRRLAGPELVPRWKELGLQEIIDAARTLSPAERLWLVDAVWDDEHPENWPVLSPEWLAEVQRRSAEFDTGRMKASPWEDVQARVRRQAGLDG